MTVDLYFFQPLGTNSGRVYLALLEKGVPFVEHHVTAGAHLQPEFLKINPRGQVPAMVHDGHAMNEGMCINEYIDETFDGPPLRPANLIEREHMRAWSRYAENDLGRAIMMVNWNRVVPSILSSRSEEDRKKYIASVPDAARRRSWQRAFEQETDPAEIEESHRRMREGVQRAEAAFTQRPYLAGDSYSLADIDFYNFCAGILMRWMPELVNEQATPAFVEWMQRINERPAVKEMLSHRTGMPTQPQAQQAR